MRSKGRSRPMSATLTTKRKSARDRPASSNERVGELGERKREIDRGARGLKARAQLGSCSRSPEGSAGPSCLAGPARSCLLLAAACETLRHACRRRRASPTCARPACRCCCRPRRRAVAATPLSAALSPAQSTSGAAPVVAACRHLCRARTRMREIWCVGGVWRALGEHVLDRFAAAAPAALVWPQE